MFNNKFQSEINSTKQNKFVHSEITYTEGMLTSKVCTNADSKCMRAHDVRTSLKLNDKAINMKRMDNKLFGIFAKNNFRRLNQWKLSELS